MLKKPNKDTFLIVDGHALIYRAYHAFPPLNSFDGKLVNALYGFLRVLLSTIKDLQPAYVAVAFDHPSPTQRKQKFEFYKANRKEMPDDLKEQIPLIKEAVCKLGIPTFEIAGIEADDLIGTVTKLTTTLDDLYTLILTGDKDSFQLVDENVNVYLSQIGHGKKGAPSVVVYDRDGVHERMGVWPEQIVDLKALAGDSSDNIPGVMGIGEKSAVKLLQTYDTLDNIYEKIDQDNTGSNTILKGSLREKLKTGKENAYMSQALATIDRNVELDFEINTCSVTAYNQEEMVEFLKLYSFNSLLKMLPADDFVIGIQDELFS